MCGWQVKLCDSTAAHGLCVDALEIKSLYIKRYINSSVYFTVLYTRWSRVGTMADPGAGQSVSR